MVGRVNNLKQALKLIYGNISDSRLRVLCYVFVYESVKNTASPTVSKRGFSMQILWTLGAKCWRDPRVFGAPGLNALPAVIS